MPYIGSLITLFTLCLPFCMVSVYALTAEDIKRLALESHLGLKAENLEFSARQIEVERASKWSNPQLNLVVGTYNTAGSEAPVREFNLSQAIPLTNKFSVQKDLAEQQKEEQKLQVEQLKIYVMNQALLASWKCYVSHQLYKHGEERAKRIALIKKYLETRPRVSLKQQVDLSIISSSLILLEKEQDQKLYQLQNVSRELSFWIGKEINSEELEITIPSSVELKLATFNPEHMLDFNLAKFSLQKSLLEKKLAAKNKIPDITLGVGYREEQVYPSNRQPYLMAGVSLPLWDTGDNAYRASSLRASAAEVKLHEAQRALKMDYEKQVELVKYTYKQFKRTPVEVLYKLENSIKTSEQAFKQGAIDINTFIQAENMLHDVVDLTFTSWLDFLTEKIKLSQMNAEVISW